MGSRAHQTAPLPSRRWEWTLLGLLCLSTALNYVDRLALSILIGDVRRELGIDTVMYGHITTLFMLAYAVSQLAMGVLIDRVGTRLGLGLCVGVWSFAAIGHSLVATTAGLLAVRLMLGLGEGGNWPAGTKAISEWVPKQRRAFSMGLFDGGSALGAVVAPPLVAFLGLMFGWRAAFIVIGALGFAWLAGWLWVMPGKPAALAGDARKVVSLGHILARGVTWGLLFTRMLATPVWWFYIFWLPDYLGQSRGFGLKEIGMFAWIPYVVVDLGKLTGGALSDWGLRRGWKPLVARKTVMGAGAFLMMAGLLVVRSGSSAEAIFWVSVATFGFGIWSPNVFAVIGDLYAPGEIARATGFTGMGASLGGALFSSLTGLLVASFGYGPAFLVAGLSAPAAFICLLLFVR